VVGGTLSLPHTAHPSRSPPPSEGSGGGGIQKSICKGKRYAKVIFRVGSPLVTCASPPRRSAPLVQISEYWKYQNTGNVRLLEMSQYWKYRNVLHSANTIIVEISPRKYHNVLLSANIIIVEMSQRKYQNVLHSGNIRIVERKDQNVLRTLVAISEKCKYQNATFGFVVQTGCV